MDPNGRTDPHSHENIQHLFIVLKGELGIKTAHGDLCVSPGEAVLISPGDFHANFNASKGETEYIAVTWVLAV